MELYSPAAIETAPAMSPARPASRTTPGAGSAPATPRIRPTFDTRPSLTPNTAARAAPPRTSRWWCSGRGAISGASIGRSLGGSHGRSLDPLRPRHRLAARVARGPAELPREPGVGRAAPAPARPRSDDGPPQGAAGEVAGRAA